MSEKTQKEGESGVRPSVTGAAPAPGHVPVVVWQLMACCRERGLPPEPYFEQLGLQPEDLTRPGCLVDTAVGLELVRRMLTGLGPLPQLGLRCGRSINLSKLGVLAMGLQASPTLGEALALTLRHPWSAGFFVSLHVGPGPGQDLRAEPLPGGADLMPFLTDNLFAAMVALRRRIAGEDYAPQRVELVHPVDGDARGYEDFFRCPVQFDAPRNRLLTSQAWLERPLPTGHLSTWHLARDMLDRMAREHVRLPPLAQAVDRILRQGMPRPPAPAALAGRFNVSERSLRRKLAELGLSYELLLDRVRHARAEELIRNPALSLTQVADQLGFTDVRAFRRAFRRWTGHSPSEARGHGEAGPTDGTMTHHV